MLAALNDSAEDARALVKLLRDLPVKVNLIPFNPFPHTSYKTSSEQAIGQFTKIITDAGLISITRRTRGEDIDAACGQLAGKVQDKTRRSARFMKVVGE